MASIHSALTDAGEPGPPHVVRFRWKPELDAQLRAGRETFKRIDTARRWLRDFDEARETGGWPGVREFVLAWRARDAEPDEEPEEPTLAEFMKEWLRRDAVPNLAPNTIASYLPAYNNHIRALPVNAKDPNGRVFGELPLSEFAEPHVHNEFRESLKLTGRSKANQDAAKKVLSSALSWGVESRTYRRWLPTNGAKLVTGRRRRSNRGHPAARADVRLPRSRVFNAFDYELVRAELIARTDQRTWQPHRDAVMLDLQFGCGCRPEEARGARWWQVLWPTLKAPGVLRVRQVVAAGQIDDGKTVDSLRDAILPGVIAERLREWREIASTHGLPAGPQDFIVPGQAPRRGRNHPGGHMTQSQEKRWGGKYLRPACTAAGQADTARAYLADATPYAGRRGHISSRLAAGESVPAVAASCGTSRKTITAHYHEDVGEDFKRPHPPFEQQLARAREEIARIWAPRTPATETLRCESGNHEWQRQKQPGPKPRSCPEHRSKRAPADIADRAPLPAGPPPPRGASAPSDVRPRERRERRGATLRDAATSLECVVSVSATQGTRSP
jgi:integrase